MHDPSKYAYRFGRNSMDFSKYFLYLNALVWGTFFIFLLGGFALIKIYFYSKLQYRKIVPLETHRAQHINEFKDSFTSQFVFILAGVAIYYLNRAGWTQLYSDYNKFGYWYLPVSFFIVHTLHDTYFYWTHRAMHEVSWLKKIHIAHHRSRVPTPLAASSFSVGEALVQGLFYVLIALIVPLHWSVLISFYIFLTWISTWGHMEFEWWPNFLYRFPYSYSFNSLTTHNLHHYYGKGNYALYYRFWDEVCGTSHPQTYEHFYAVRKRIQEHFGHEDSLFRPHPNDQAGLYFEEIMNYGEDVNIPLGQISFSQEPQILNPADLTNIPHRYCDGISALKVLHSREQKKITLYPQVEKHEHFLWTFAGVKGVFASLLKLILTFPYRGYGWKDLSQNKKELVTITLSKEETTAALQKAKALGVSFNSQLVWAVQNATTQLHEKSRWILPVWFPKKKCTIADAPIRNHSSIIELDLLPAESPKTIDDKINKEFEENGIWFWAKSFDLLNILLKYPFKIFVFISLKGLRRTGTISNLGRMEGELKAPLIIAPPALTNTPVSFAALTYNGMLSITVQSKPNHGPSSQILVAVLRKVKVNLLN